MMANTPKRLAPASYANQRELIELAKTMDLAQIVRKAGRTPQNILVASPERLGLSINGRK
jgi:hypothetical protein